MDTPLIYTKNGNVPIDSLRFEHEWVDGESVLMLHLRWFDKETGELMKNDMHGYAKKSFVIGGEQATM